MSPPVCQVKNKKIKTLSRLDKSPLACYSTAMTYRNPIEKHNDVVNRWNQYLWTTEMREGQAAYTALHDVDPRMANIVADTPDADPFYDDANLFAFWMLVNELITGEQVFAEN